MTLDSTLITALRARLQSAEACSVELLETHISWILVAPTHAFKIKKPVKLDFLDFSTLELRRHFCEEELRLNRRLAPALYLAMVPITGSPSQPELSGAGRPIEFAVKMRSFSQDQLLSRMLDAGKLQPGHVDQLARRVAHFHLACPGAPAESRWGSPEVVARHAVGNLEALGSLSRDSEIAERVAPLEAWTRAETARLTPHFLHRKSTGFVRECHGDLHLGNLIFWAVEVLPFDALEFSAELRWIDVLNEIAFTVMDLEHRGRADFAARFFNLYLELTGDYEGVRVMRYYTVYRAVVRAYVSALRGVQLASGSDSSENARADARNYLGLAGRLSQPSRPNLWITYGVSGSGKTTGTQRWLEEHAAIRIRSDVERKRLFNVPATQKTPAAQGDTMYSAEATLRVYDRLRDMAEVMLRAGHSVIVDAAFLRRADRDCFRGLADRLGVPFAILAFDAPEDELRRRITQRLQEGRDASDADLDILNRQLATRQALAPDEPSIKL